jgi:hypothetical protein
MRRLGLALTLCLLAHLALPSPAHAWWHWIDELSGPGPFNGFEVDLRLVCFSEQVATKKVDEERDDNQRLKKAMLAGSLPPGCRFKPVPLENQRRASLNLDVAYLWANRSNLQYADQGRHSVHLFILRPTFWVRPARSIEVGAGVSLYHFDGNSFNAFSRVVIEPLIFDLKPLALIRDALGQSDKNDLRDHPDSQWDLLVSLRFGMAFIPKGFDATDFGAIPGTYHTPHDFLPTVSLFLDWDPIARRLRQKHP